MSELAKDLRERANKAPSHRDADALHSAANEIERLERELATMRDALEDLWMHHQTEGGNGLAYIPANEFTQAMYALFPNGSHDANKQAED